MISMLHNDDAIHVLLCGYRQMKRKRIKSKRKIKKRTKKRIRNQNKEMNT